MNLFASPFRRPAALLATALLLACVLAPAQPFAQTMIDNIDYMEDGMMTPDEMEAEAAQVEQLCSLNAVQNQLYDCGCFSAAFLIRRERLGPLEPQSMILQSLTSGPMGRKCVNAPLVAGNAYQNCRSFMQAYREMERNVEPYCECVARRVSAEFSREPAMSPSYLATLSSRARRWCNEPGNLERAKAAAPAAVAPIGAGPATLGSSGLRPATLGP